MKRGIVFAVALLAVFTAGAARAKTLEEVLREKGVITEEDFKAVTRSRPVAYKTGEGFELLSREGRFRLVLGGNMQFRYTFTDKDDVNASQQDVSEWRLKRVKLSLGGHAYTSDLTYKLVLNFVEAGSVKLLEEAFVSYRFRDELNLLVGQNKVPFSREDMTSTNALQFVDRTTAVEAFKPSYDIGAMLHGRIADGWIVYSAGISGGVGQGTPRTTNNSLLGARVAVNPLGEMKYAEGDIEGSPKPLVAFGLDYFQDTLILTKGATDALETNNLSFAGSSGWLGKGFSLFPVTEKLDVRSASADFILKWRGFSLQSEYLAGQAEGKTSGALLRAQGFYVQSGYFVLPRRLELAGRYAYVDFNRDKADDLQVETQAAVSYCFDDHNLKVQGDFTNTHRQVAGSRSTDDRQVRLQAQILF